MSRIADAQTKAAIAEQKKRQEKFLKTIPAGIEHGGLIFWLWDGELVSSRYPFELANQIFGIGCGILDDVRNLAKP